MIRVVESQMVVQAEAFDPSKHPRGQGGKFGAGSGGAAPAPKPKTQARAASGRTPQKGSKIFESPYVYHGTTTGALADIMKNGLRGRLFVTELADVAWDEAAGRHVLKGPGQKPGAPVLLKISTRHPSIANGLWKKDPEYDPGDQEEFDQNWRAFKSEKARVPPSAIRVVRKQAK